MSQDPNIRTLLAPMAEREVDLDGPEFHVDRERLLARLEQDRRKPRVVRARWLAPALLAAAVVFGLVAGARLWRHPRSRPSLEVVTSRGSVTQFLDSAHVQVSSADGTFIAAEGELSTTADSNARLRTPDGIELELRSRTRVALGQLESHNGLSAQVSLLGGTLRCSVPHRSEGHVFRVVTPDVTVVDVGTVFTVTLDETGHTAQVSVEEGEVMVEGPRSQVRVHAPDTWSSVAGDASGAVEANEPGAGESTSPTPRGEGGREAPGPLGTKGTHPSIKAPAPTLDQEAQLLRQGLAAERQGRSSDAITAFTQLLSKYPRSQLAPLARDALARVEAGQRQ